MEQTEIEQTETEQTEIEQTEIEQTEIEQTETEQTELEQKILLVLDNKPYIINHTKPITIHNLITNTLKHKLNTEDYENYKCNSRNYYYLKNGKPALPESIIPIDNTTYYIVGNSRLNGGGDDITDIIGFIFTPIFPPFALIGKIIILIIKFVTWLALFVVWFVQFVIWLLTDLLNPITLILDFVNSVKLIIIALVSAVINIVMSLFAFIINNLGDWMQSFWGWDQSNLTKSDKDSKYFKGIINKDKGKKCYITDGNTIPFSVILGTVLCPPLGVFMDMGVAGWLNIVICCLLTLVFYIPGLAYALLIIYS
jgi:uncharacterized membrane protein YqaE (UPF0057 family)